MTKTCAYDGSSVKAKPAAIHAIVPREKLDFQLDGDIPKYWMNGDPFKSRFWDALSIIFPPGEKYFMTSVRAFREHIQDPKMLEEIRDFNKQEAQHTLVHKQDNERLRRQGIKVDHLTAYVDNLLNKGYAKRYSAAYNLAATAALEHFTSIIAHSLFDKRDVMKGADERVRAMYSWHAIEEVEHKGVAYDVMTDYAKVGYFKRVFALMHASVMFPMTIARIQRDLLKQDGFNTRQRVGMMVKGLWWMLKPGGLLQPMYRSYFTYYRPGFHPWQETEQPGYTEWVSAFEKTGDPVNASEQTRFAMGL